MSENQPQPTEAAPPATNLPNGVVPHIEGQIPAGAIPAEPVVEEPAPAPAPVAEPQQPVVSEPKDVVMTDGPAEQPTPPPAASTGPAVTPASVPVPSSTTQNSAPSPVPARTSTPGVTMPSETPAHGAPIRQYLNSKVTGTLLEGMKIVAREQPKDPLRVLGEYLIQRSKELETST